MSCTHLCLKAWRFSGIGKREAGKALRTKYVACIGCTYKGASMCVEFDQIGCNVWRYPCAYPGCCENGFGHAVESPSDVPGSIEE